MLKASVRLDMGKLPKYRDSPQRMDKVLRTAAIDVQAGAIQGIRAVDAIDTGATMNSIAVTPGDSPGSYRIGPRTAYAIWIEIGSQGRAARPFLVPAFESVQSTLQARVKEAFQ